MNEYTVVPLDQVRPGDVAVCNGREFPVEWRGSQNQVRLGEWYVSATFASDTLGCEFRRPAPREPRTFEGYVNCIEFDGQVKICPDCTLLPCSWERKRVRITEVMEP